MKGKGWLVVRLTDGEKTMAEDLAATFEMSQSSVVRLALRRLYRQIAESGLPPADIMQDLAVQALRGARKDKKGGK